MIQFAPENNRYSTQHFFLICAGVGTERQKLYVLRILEYTCPVQAHLLCEIYSESML